MILLWCTTVVVSSNEVGINPTPEGKKQFNKIICIHYNIIKTRCMLGMPIFSIDFFSSFLPCQYALLMKLSVYWYTLKLWKLIGYQESLTHLRMIYASIAQLYWVCCKKSVWLRHDAWSRKQETLRKGLLQNELKVFYCLGGLILLLSRSRDELGWPKI